MTSDRAGGPAPQPSRRSGLGSNAKLLDLLQTTAITTPGFVRMRRHPEIHGWTADLVGFAAHEELLALAEPLKRVAEIHAEGPSTFAPFFEALGTGANAADLRTLIRASQVSAECCKERPYASFMLAWATSCMWVLRAMREGRDLYYDQAGPLLGMVDGGWRSIPRACIAASVRLHGLYGSALLAEEAHSVLQTNARRRPEWQPGLEPALAEYRRLGRTIAGRRDTAIASLADDLRDACRSSGGRTRRLVAALLWTLGLVPECHAFRASTDPPSGALMRRVVRSSLRYLPTDPLVQYVWLEMKDAPELDLRAHESLYAVINHRWDQWLADRNPGMFGLSAEPSRQYARTLEALLSDDLAEEAAAEYVHENDWIVDVPPGAPPQAFARHRFEMLRHLIGERFGLYDASFTARKRIDWLREETVIAARARRRATTYPEWPDAGTRTSISAFELIERSLNEDVSLEAPERERCAFALEALECFRTGALAYWLDVNPPRAPESASDPLQQLLSEEREQLELLRGAYFVALRPTLPVHFMWSDMDLSQLLALEEDAEHRAAFYSAEVGRQEMDEAERALACIANSLSVEAPDYASFRQRPTADVGRLTSMLCCHHWG